MVLQVFCLSSSVWVCSIQIRLFVFTKGTGLHFVAFLVYVDDIIITGPSLDVINALKSFLHTQFKLKDFPQPWTCSFLQRHCFFTAPLHFATPWGHWLLSVQDNANSYGSSSPSWLEHGYRSSGCFCFSPACWSPFISHLVLTWHYVRRTQA